MTSSEPNEVPSNATTSSASSSSPPASVVADHDASGGSSSITATTVRTGPRAFFRQVHACVKKNLRVQTRNRVSRTSLFIMPVLTTLAFLPLCGLLLYVDTLTDTDVTPRGITVHHPADIPNLTSTDAVAQCNLDGTPCTLAVAPDTEASHAIARELAASLYDAEAGRTAPLIFLPNKSALDALVLDNTTDLFGAIWLGDLDAKNKNGNSYELYMRAVALPTDSAYLSPVTMGSSLSLGNSTLYLTGGLATLQRALHAAISGRNASAGPTVRSLAFPSFHFSLAGSSVAVIAAIFHTLTFSSLVTVSLVKLVEEKNNKTREFLLMLGLRKSAYWVSWLLTFLIFTVYVDTLFVVVATFLGLVSVSSLFGLICNMLMFNVSLIISFFAFESLFSSTVIISAVASFWLLVPVVSAYILPVNKALHIVMSLFFSPFGYFLSVSQFISSSLGSLPVTYVSQPGFFFLFIFNSLITSFVAWYLGKITPTKYGVKEHPLFIFTARFWRGVLSHFFRSSTAVYSQLVNADDMDDLDSDAGNNSEDGAFEQQDMSRATVRVIDLVKCFEQKNKDPVMAVNGVSAAFCQGNITALLGENGAGKSTLISTLCGLHGPTSGNAFVDGKSVRSDMDSIRSVLGVCPQDDVLFPMMTAVEHVSLIADIRGVQYPDGMNAKAYAQQVLGTCGVQEDEHNGCRVENMSGGMKRKLSLTMALVGAPRVLFLDEPTSGVDAVAKRSIWQTLIRLKQSRTVILTTHSMEEADSLSDYIYIMHEGRMKTGGSPMYLKNRCGVGCYLNIDLQQESDRVPSITALVEQNVPGSRIHDQTSSMVSYLLPHDKTQSYGRLLHQLDDENIKNTFGIKSYGISLCTMNDVFVRICSPEGTVNSGLPPKGDESPGTTTTTTGTAATKSKADRNTVTVLPDDNSYMGKASVSRQFVSLSKAKLLYYIREKKSLGTMLFMPFIQTLLYCLVVVITLDSGIGGTQIEKMSLNTTSYKNDAFPVFLNSTNYDNKTLSTFTDCMTSSLKTKSVFYSDFDSMVDDIISKSGHSYGLFVDKFLSNKDSDINVTVMYNETLTHTLPQVLDAAYNCLFDMGASGASLHSVFSVTEDSVSEAAGFNMLGAAMVLCTVFSLISVSWHPMEKLIVEREKCFKQQVYTAGCRPFVFVLASVFSNGVALLPAILIAFIILMIFGLVSFSLAVTILINGIIFAFAVAAFNYWISSRFSKASSATIMISLIMVWVITIPMLFSVIISVLLLASNALLTPFTEFLLRLFQFLLELVPPFAFMNTVINTMFFPSNYPLSLIFAWKSKYALDMIGLILDLLLYFCFCLAKEYKMDSVTKSHPRTESPVLSADEDVQREYHRVTSSSSSRDHNDALRIKRLGKIYEPPKKSCLQRILCCCQPLLQQQQQQQQLPGQPKLERVEALKDVTLGVPLNECFGILGPNGSGKTTAMNIITAQLDATYGNVELLGVPLEESRQQFQSACHIGHCLQADGLLDYMTAREHLTLLLSMRGGADGVDVPMGVLKNDVSAVLEAMDIGEHSDREAKTFSGGFLRRLNVATALLPGVRVLVLDEPSTGMDVVSQRALWDAIRQKRKQSGKVVLLTTHSMEEAEAVCSRIAILLKGSLEGFGSVQHLRDKHSDGHIVTLFVNSSDCDDALMDEFFKVLSAESVCAHAERVMVTPSPSAVQVTYKLSGVRNLATLFDTLDALRESHQPALQQYAVTQASLESVFVHMIQDLDEQDSH